MDEIIKTWLEILTSAGVVLSVVWKFALLPLHRHIQNVSNLLHKIPEMFSKVEAQEGKLNDIKRKIYPNGGSSLDDKLNKIMDVLHYQSESSYVSWKLSPDAICRTNKDGQVIFVNYAWLALAGFSSPEEAYGIGWIRAIHPEDRAGLRQQWEETVETGSSLQTSFRMKNVQTGKITIIDSHCNIIRDQSGTILEFFAILTPRDES